MVNFFKSLTTSGKPTQICVVIFNLLTLDEQEYLQKKIQNQVIFMDMYFMQFISNTSVLVYHIIQYFKCK